jgi:hypothetical protein
MMTEDLVTSREYQIDQDLERLIADLVAGQSGGDGNEEKAQGEVIRQIYLLVNDRVRLLVPRMERL